VAKVPEVETIFTIAGVRGEPTRGKLYVKLKRDRQLTTNQVQEQLRAQLPPLAGVTTSIEDILFVETGDDTPLKLVLQGEDLALLTQTLQTLRQKVQQLPGLVDVKINGDNPDYHIDHYNGLRSATLSANLAPNYALGNTTQQVNSLAQSLLPPGISLNLQGDSARSGVIFQEFGVTLLLAIICMLVVVYLPFGRLLEPLVVGLSLPLSLVGAMVGLLVTQSDFGMISLIGLIFLLGLLDKNAILLMDYINQLRQKGIDRTTAILTTGVVRLRPIMMTTVATILGMLPLALGWGVGAELRQPMAVAIIGGLVTSSLLSLIVVPVLYTILEDYGGKVLGQLRKN
jgi:multidrug efflux pump subunit AcrB